MNLIASALDAANGNNYEESKFLSNLIGWLITSSKSQTIDHKILTWEPEKLVLQIDGSQGTTGVLVREAFFPNWHAYVEYGGQKQELKIYEAGPELMYIMVPIQGGSSTQVALTYESSTLNTVSLSMSLVSLAVLGLWVWRGGQDLEQILGRPVRRMRETWAEEE